MDCLMNGGQGEEWQTTTQPFIRDNLHTQPLLSHQRLLPCVEGESLTTVYTGPLLQSQSSYLTIIHTAPLEHIHTLVIRRGLTDQDTISTQ